MKKSHRSAAHAAAPLSAAVSQAILQAIGNRGIPTMPSAAQKAFRLSVDPKAEANDFVEVIQTDEALSARVIKISNSVFFDRGPNRKKCVTIEEAVAIIGINELKNLLSATTLSDLFPSQNPAREQFWKNDIATAIIAKLLARRKLPQQSEIAFLGGLMHDIGKLLLLQRIEDYRKVLEMVRADGRDFVAAEEELFVFNHTQVGQLIAQRWKFSDDLVGMIRDHHQRPASAGRGGVSLAQLVQMGDVIAHALGLGHPAGYGRFRKRHEEQLPEVWKKLGMNQVDADNFLEESQKAFDVEYDLYMGGGERGDALL